MAEAKPEHVIPWTRIEALKGSDVLTNGALGALDALRSEWERRLSKLSEEERNATRLRSLRKLAIETGTLRAAHDVEWGLTLTLIAEGFTKDVVERTGGVIDDRTLATLRAQMDSLGLVLDFVRNDRALSPSFIKELHQAMTRTQDTYVMTNALGVVVETALPRGDWKKTSNHVVRQDGTLLEYCPPEHVVSEIDGLVTMWTSLDREAVHPIIKTAWLHHRFVQIHPFADGNGRVGRALMLLVLEKHRYAPLVVDRWHRKDYLEALDQANDGDLKPLVRLLIKLESAALASELERPEEIPSKGPALDVAHTLADQLSEMRRRRQTQVQKALEARGVAVAGTIKTWFERKGDDLAGVFRERGLNDVRILADLTAHPSGKLQWFRRQIIDSAKTAGHYADFRVYTAWASLRIDVEGVLLRYVASLHGAGREAGIMAVTTFAEIEDELAEDGGEVAREYVATTRDAFRFVHSEGVDQIQARAPELEELLDEGLAEALARLLSRV